MKIKTNNEGNSGEPLSFTISTDDEKTSVDIKSTGDGLIIIADVEDWKVQNNFVKQDDLTVDNIVIYLSKTKGCD